MKTHEELMQTAEYWLVAIQNDLFGEVHDFMKENGWTQADLGRELGIKKSRVSQILNGNFNHRISTLIEICLAIGRAPMITFPTLESVIAEEKEINDRTKMLNIVDFQEPKADQGAPEKFIYIKPDNDFQALQERFWASQIPVSDDPSSLNQSSKIEKEIYESEKRSNLHLETRIYSKEK